MGRRRRGRKMFHSYSGAVWENRWWKQSHAWRYCPVLVTERFCTFSLECLRILIVLGNGGSRTQRESVQCSFSQAKPGQGSSNLSERRRRAAVGRRAAAASDDNGSGGSGEQQQPTAITWQMLVHSSEACLAASDRPGDHCQKSGYQARQY